MSGPTLAPWRTRDGREVWLVTRAALEGAPGWHPTHGGRRGRGACILHGGDNRQAMEADLETGWIRCRTRGCLGRLADHPDTYGAGGDRPAYGAPLERASATSSPTPRMLTNVDIRPPAGRLENLTKPDIPRAREAGEVLRKPKVEASPDQLAELRARLELAAAALPGSPGAAYLERRRIPLELAARHGLGWATVGKLRGRVVFPLTNPTGEATSATGRAVNPGDEPRYLTLAAATYPKGWHNAGAIAAARSSGGPVYLCEGPFDALALAAGGVGTAVAMLGTDDPGRLVAWLAGVPQVIVCLDADEAGQAAARKVAAALALFADVRILAPAALGDCGDLAEYWERHGALPAALLVPPAPRPAEESADEASTTAPGEQPGQFVHPKKGAEPADELLEAATLETTETVPTPLPAYPLTCPEALALELGGGAAYAVDWADELAALAPEELEAYAARMAGCGPMGQAAILEARYRAATASPAEVAA